MPNVSGERPPLETGSRKHRKPLNPASKPESETRGGGSCSTRLLAPVLMRVDQPELPNPTTPIYSDVEILAAIEDVAAALEVST